ncbi:MAG: 4-alpha-glucanotransferase [Gammaproteobacteria bacterium]
MNTADDPHMPKAVDSAPLLFDKRRAGVLLHPTSLPSGELGPDAYRFVDFLTAAGISVWQMLPLGPPHEDASPYQCMSTHAGSERLISIAQLVEWAWLAKDAESLPRHIALKAAREGLARAPAEMQDAYQRFKSEHAHWLDDYALYRALRAEYRGAAWWQWPAALRDRDAAAMTAAQQQLAAAVEQVRFEQFAFFRQWLALKQYANSRGLLLFGDLPIFVAHDSAEVWAQRGYFAIDDQGQLLTVAGVPPDYFSATGQRWGNPLYRWEHMQADGFAWWLARLRTQLELYDLLRIDHFRGFEAYWEIPAAEPTAINGRWVQAPGEALFATLHQHIDPLPLIAEDLGVITPPVDALRRKYGLPGMKILQFAFDSGADNPYLPHNHERNSVVYTGTHDNATTLGWFDNLSAEQRQHVLDYLGADAREAMPWPVIRAALASVADLAILPMQDVLVLGSEHRMNLPGTPTGNWSWRFEWAHIPPESATGLRRMIELYGRLT